MAPLRALRRLGGALASAHRHATVTASKCSPFCNSSPSSSFDNQGSLAGARGSVVGPSSTGSLRTAPAVITGAYLPQTRRCFASGVSENALNEAGSKKETISVTFVNKDGEEKLVQVPIGMSMLDAAQKNDIELEGACEGSLACSTCHVIVTDEKYYEKLSEPTDEENDMLDLAFGLTQTSRLGCQVLAQPELDGMKLALPSATRNFAVDGFVPKPH